jgi:transposase-like protein
MNLCNGALAASEPTALNAQTKTTDIHCVKNKSSQSITANTKLIKSNGMQRITYTITRTSKKSLDKHKGRNKVENSGLLTCDAVLLGE